MVPTEQKIVWFYNEINKKGLDTFCKEWIEKGYIIHQIVPDTTFKKSYYLILYKY